MTAVVTAAVVVGAGTIYASNKSSAAQRDAAKKQSEGIDNAARISAEAARSARVDALALFNPSFKDITTSLNQARGDLLEGKTSAANLLNTSFLNAATTLQTTGQQAFNAILGRGTGKPQVQAGIPEPDPNQGGVQIAQPNIDPELLAELKGIKDGGGFPPQTGRILPAEDIPNIMPRVGQTPDYDPNSGGLRANQIPQQQAQQPVSSLRQQQQPLPEMSFNDNSLRGGNFQFNPAQTFR